MRVLLAVLVRGLLLAGLWWVLTEGRPGYLLYGALTVPVVLGVSLWLAPAGRLAIGPRPSPRPARLAERGLGLARLVGWYAAQVALGGVDVARRLLRRRADVDPLVVQVRTRLPEGAARQLAVAMYGLMPGSLVSGTDGDLVQLHSLHEELGPVAQWRDLEDHLAHAAGLDLPDPQPDVGS